MALTPVEIRHIKLGRSLFGYSRGVIDELLEDIVESFEQVWRERADLADKIENFTVVYNRTAKPYRWTYDGTPLKAA